MTKFLKGSKTIASNDGKTRFNQGGNKLLSTDPDSGTMSTYFIGEILATLVGGSLTGTPYSAYVLTIKIHHNFSTDFPNLTPLYEFWRDYRYAYQQIIEAAMGSVVGGASTGVWTETTSHRMVRNIENTVADEYMQFVWAVTRSSGTTVIPAGALRLIPHIKYFNQPLTITNVTVEGGGGGTLYENFDFYI